MNKRSNKTVSHSAGIWITDEPAIVTDNLNIIQESMEQSILLCEEDISDEELMAMIAGQRNI